jgi:hypothetical protein
MKVAASLFLLSIITFASDATKLSDVYGKAAFLALKAIERDSSQFGLESTNKSIDLADAEATTDEEKAITQVFKHMHGDKTINNLERETELMKFKNKAILMGKVEDLSQNPRLKAIDQREAACFKPFEDGLRARDVGIPPQCNNLLEATQPKAAK